MNAQKEKACSNQGSNVPLEDKEWLNLIAKSESEDKGRLNLIAESGSKQPLSSSSARIKRVPPEMLKHDGDYEKYYVPKFASIGPYHSGNPKLVRAQNLKPVYTMGLLSNIETVEILYKKLGEPEMVQKLRDFYEENSTKELCDKEFTRMMLQDACFILYCIQHRLFLADGIIISQGLNSQDQDFIYQDLLLVENQIPWIVLHEVVNISKIQLDLNLFLNHSNIWATGVPTDLSVKIEGERNVHYSHLLQCWQHANGGTRSIDYRKFNTTTRSVNELMDVGIHFEPSKDSYIEFFRGWGLCLATLRLLPITLDDYTKTTLLNLLAYEMCCNREEDTNCRAFTSYIRLLRYMINQPEDVSALREAGVLYHSLGSDSEVVKLLKELGCDLMPENDGAYVEAMHGIEAHYERFKKVYPPISQFKREYFKSPWTFFALVGAILALLLTAVQTYFTVWSPKGDCDDLCKFLKMNHHL